MLEKKVRRREVGTKEMIVCEAEKYLAGVQRYPGFPVRILEMIEQHCKSDAIQDKQLRMAAAVFFKNTIKKFWAQVTLPREFGAYYGGHGCRKTIKNGRKT